MTILPRMGVTSYAVFNISICGQPEKFGCHNLCNNLDEWTTLQILLLDRLTRNLPCHRNWVV